MKRAAVVSAVLLLALGLWLLRRSPSSPNASHEGTSAQHDAPGAHADGPATEPARTAPTDPSDAMVPPERTVHDRALRDRLRAAIVRAWTASLDASAAALPADPVHAPMPSLPDGRVDPDYVRARIREDFLPMAQACYAQYERRVPGQSGRVVMRFVVVGDARIGGVIDEAEVEGVDGGVDGAVLGDGGTGDAEFATCLRESMMAMAFAPPPQGGSLRVTYPFRFAPTSPDAGP